MAVAEVGKKDVLWSFAAMFVKVGAGVLLLPVILYKLPSETVGVWTIFTSVSMITLLFDFGFNQSFTRNVSYIFSGVKSLKRQGYEMVEDVSDDAVDYGLLKSTIRAMRWFYSRMAMVMFVLLMTLGSYYIYVLMGEYGGDVREVYVSWVVVCVVNGYQLYTMYYESMLMGRGLVKRANQITLSGNVVYLGVATGLLLMDRGLLAVVSSQALSVVVIRVQSYYAFYTKEMRVALGNAAGGEGYREVLAAIAPNAVKLGLTALGGIVITRASTFIGSLYVSLEEMASYGISMQLLLVMAQVADALSRVYMPKIFQWRVEGRVGEIRRMYGWTSAFVAGVFVMGGTVLVLAGNVVLEWMGSHTLLLPGGVLAVMVLQRYLESNHVNAANFLVSKNEVPFFKASLISAGGVVVLLYIFEAYLDMGVWGMVLAPTVVQAVYQNWRW